MKSVIAFSYPLVDTVSISGCIFCARLTDNGFRSNESIIKKNCSPGSSEWYPQNPKYKIVDYFMINGDIQEAMIVGTEFATETRSHYGGFALGSLQSRCFQKEEKL